MSDIRFEGWLHRSGTGGVYQDSAGNVGIASTQPKTSLDIGNGGFQVGTCWNMHCNYSKINKYNKLSHHLRIVT